MKRIIFGWVFRILQITVAAGGLSPTCSLKVITLVCWSRWVTSSSREHHCTLSEDASERWLRFYAHKRSLSYLKENWTSGRIFIGMCIFETRKSRDSEGKARGRIEQAPVSVSRTVYCDTLQVVHLLSKYLQFQMLQSLKLFECPHDARVGSSTIGLTRQS